MSNVYTNPNGKTINELWKQIPDYPEFEASNLGNVRVRGTRKSLPVCWDTNSGNSRVALESPKMGRVGFVQLGSLVASAWIGERPLNCKIGYKNGNREDNNVANLEWIPKAQRKDTLQVPPQTPDFKKEIAKDVKQVVEVTAPALMPRYCVLDVGGLVLTADLALARGIARLQKLDIYELVYDANDGMPTWTLGNKVE